MKQFHRRLSSLLASGILAFGLLVVSNPESPRHERAIYSEFSALHPLYQPLGFSSGVVARTSYHSALVLSFTTHRGQLVSIGAFGQVWVRPGGFLTEVQPAAPGSLVVGRDAATLE